MSKPHIGMKADEVLKMKGRSANDSHQDPSVTFGPDGEIIQVVWHYDDLSVTLAYDGSCYRVKEVHDVIPT